jgi:hypothetical protein
VVCGVWHIGYAALAGGGGVHVPVSINSIAIAPYAAGLGHVPASAPGRRSGGWRIRVRRQPASAAGRR